jgi:riboflavin kinase/FMN adenylyltransferase
MICATSLQQLPGFGIHRIAVACGVFDGLHGGHQDIIRSVIEQSRLADAEPVVLTFNPHPLKILNPAMAPKVVLGQRHQLYLLSQFGIEVTVIMPFTHQLARQSPRDFIDSLFSIRDLTLSHLCVGEKWRFGHGAQGDTRLLQEFSGLYPYELITIPERLHGNVPISSTRLLAAVLEGNLSLAAELLGRPFSLFGKVDFGKGIATSSLHCPTANLSTHSEVFPPHGIYAVKVRLFSPTMTAEHFHGVLYLGKSPTFVDDPPDKPYVEVHIFDFNREIYGRMMEVEFHQLLRPDQKFATTDALCRQIAGDIDAAKAALGISPS